MKFVDEAVLSGVAGAEHVRPQMTTRHLVVGDRLECGPVVGVEENLVQQPVRDVLLSDRPVHGLAEKLREGVLTAPSEFNGALKSDNVRFIHDHALYTNQFVRVNELVCVTSHKQACIVLPMRATQRKSALKPTKNKRVALPGPDGKTLAQRVSEAMAYESGRRSAQYTQKDLVADVNRMAQVDNESAPVLSQAMASAIMRGKVTRSAFTLYIAKACHVDAVWLAHGSGPMISKH